MNKVLLWILTSVIYALSFDTMHAAEKPAVHGVDWQDIKTVDWKKDLMTIAPRKRDDGGKLLPLQSYDETIKRGMSFILDDHLKWFKGPADTLLDEQGVQQMPWMHFSNVQHNGAPFPKSVDKFTSYPAFHHSLNIKTFLRFWKYADDQRALEEAVKLADWNIVHSTPADSAYGNMPYSTFEDKTPGGFRDGNGLMPDKASIMSLAYLELYEATGKTRFLKAAETIAHTLSQRQRSNGTWPFRVDPKTEKVVEEYTSSVIYAVMLFEKLDKLNGNDNYKTHRDKTWNWLMNGPIKTKEFRGFYEDIPPSPKGRTNYDCLDTIRYLLANRTAENGYLEMAKELNVWIEKTFLDKIKGFEPAEGIREQLQCNVVMGIHSLNWASMLMELSKATGDQAMRQRAMQTANYTTYYLQPDNRIVVGFTYKQMWYSCHVGVILYLFDFINDQQERSVADRHYPFDTLIENGAATSDVLEGEAHAQLSGQELCEGVIGKALKFKVGNNGVDLGDLGLKAPATLSIWLKTDSSQVDGRLLSQLEGPTTQSGALRLVGGELQIWNARGWHVLVDGLSDKGIWQHVAVAFKGDGSVTGYLNGKKSQTANSAFDFKGNRAGIGSLFLGKYGTPFVGAMDDFRIYNSVLGEKEIQQMYPAGLFEKAEEATGQSRAQTLTPLGKAASEEYLISVRPGKVNNAPFWNLKSHQFMYAPSFDFKEFKGAQQYRFSLTDKYGKAYSFEADNPYVSLKPIWLKIPTGPAKLKVEALNDKGQVIKVVGQRNFHRAAMYNGPYNKQSMTYQESVRWGLRTMFDRNYFKAWMKPGVPPEDYRSKETYKDVWGIPYPSKLLGATVAGAALYAQMIPRPDDADDVIAIGVKAADYLISLNLPTGTPLEFIPPTYAGAGAFNKYHKPFMIRKNVMMNFPCVSADAYLSLYDVTKEEKYFEAAKKVANTYRKLQLPSGTWYQVVDNNTGKGAYSTLLNPVKVVRFADRLIKQYGLTEYQDMRDKAFDYVMTSTMKTFNWQAQYEDAAPAPAYKNLSPGQACEFADYLFEQAKDNPDYIDMAIELMRFAEGQYTSWEDPIKMNGPGIPSMNSPNWILPCVSEQTGYFMPVNFSSSHLIETFANAYRATGNEVYLAKSRDLANTLLLTQQKHQGDYPTYIIPPSKDGKFEDVQNTWINCTVYTIRSVMRLSELLESAGIDDAVDTSIINGTDWFDTEGRRISAHEGEIARFGDTFYWYGSSYKNNPNGRFRMTAGPVWNGMQVYSSKDLKNWTYEGVCMPRPERGFGKLGATGRGHVMYNEKTKKYVMWYRWFVAMPASFLCVATADHPEGPFTPHGPREMGTSNGFGSDMNTFQDDDGTGYVIYCDHSKRESGGDWRYAIRIDSLSDDYLTSNRDGVVIFDSSCEAPAMVKHKGKYIAVASGVHGWAGSNTKCATANTPLGKYKKQADISVKKTWGSQVTDLIYLKESDTVMALCDQWWNPDRADIDKSRYLFLPMYLNEETGQVKMEYRDKWNPLETDQGNKE